MTDLFRQDLFRKNNYLSGSFYSTVNDHLISVAERSKARVCGLSFAGIAGSNPATGMDVSLMQEFDYLSRGVIPTVVCQCV